MKVKICRLVVCMYVVCMFVFAAAFSAASLWAQSPAASPATNTVGVVTKVDSAAREIVLKTDAGAEITLAIQATASFRRVAPGETGLQNAATIAITDISAGDRVLARGKPSDDQKSVAATMIVVMSKADIANKQAQERADWDRRGVIGIVTAVSADQVTINVRGPAGNKPLIVVPGKSAVIRRYAADSVKFANARPSKLEDIKAGDQVRARGDKSEDGAKMTADEIVSGSFHTIAATVNSIDASANVMRVTNLEGKKAVAVKINPDTVLRKLPPQMAQLLAARNRPPEERAAAGASPAAEENGRGAPGAEGRGGGRGARAAGGGDLQQMLDRTPKITLADLKPGDAIIVSSTEGSAPNQITAITLIAGVEPILTAPGRKDMALGSWTLDMEGGGGQ